MEEPQTRPSQDGDVANTTDCPADGKEETTALSEAHGHDRGRPSPAPTNGGSDPCAEKALTLKEHSPHMDTSTPHAADYVEVLSEDDGIMTVVIKEEPNPTAPSSDSATEPSMNEIEVIYQNPPSSTFGDIANLTRYSRTHSKRKTLQCLVCGKYFLRMAHLVAHEVTHSEQVAVSCSKCGQQFPSTADLLAHKKTHRTGKLFLCLECGRCYRCRGQLVLHQRRHLRDKLSMGST